MSDPIEGTGTPRSETKYGDRVGDALDRPALEPEPDPADNVTVGTHYLTVNDERETIEKYNGLQWTFVIDAGTITAVDCSHYCPGPSHVDPMGFRAWDDVPELVRNEALSALNGHGREGDVVDQQAIDEAAERSL